MYYVGIAVDKDSKEAFTWFFKAAEQGLGPAQRNIAVIYYSGVGVAKDAKEAFNLYRKAADQRDAVAQFQIGKLYDKGEDVAQDDKTAYAWFTIAWEDRVPQAPGARDKLAERLTPAQISDAKKFAQEWLDKHR